MICGGKEEHIVDLTYLIFNLVGWMCLISSEYELVLS
jgi:hypothetical protein